MTKRTICIITGSRAEYGLLRWLMEAIRDDERLSLQITVTGMHLEPAFGKTWREITDDKFQIDARIPMHMEGDSPADISAAMGCIIKGMGEALADLRPDIVVVLGDRFEILAAILAAQPARIPVAHIHGGELTEGAMDDGMRHAITKLSYLHFTAVDAYARRVVQVGEDPSRVFQVGGLGIEAITRTDYLDKQALERDLGHSLSGRLLLIATSRLIMAHTSTAIGFAVLFREPTMLLMTRDLYDRQVYEKYTYEGFSHALDTPLQFFDEPSSLEFQKPLEVNETCYEHYVNDYLRCRGAPDQPMWDTIWEAIGKHLNPEDSTNRVPPGGMPTISLQNAAFSMTHRQ